MKILPATLTGLLLWTNPVVAQAPDRSPTGHAVEIYLRERWLHGRQRPEFTLWSEPYPAPLLYIDSVRAAGVPGARALRVSFESPNGNRYTRLVHDSVGRIQQIEGSSLRWPPFPETERVRAVARSMVASRFEWGADPGFGYAEFDVAELVPTFRPTSLAPGAEWVDTLLIQGEKEGPFGGVHRSMRGVRRSRLERDTVVAGRRHWIVRDSAIIRYNERWMERDRTLDTLVIVERGGDGVIAGRHLYDPELRLFRLRFDTTEVSGEAVLSYPDGRVFRTPARYQRARRWVHRDRQEEVVRRAERLAEERSRVAATRNPPKGSLRRRLDTGDNALLDSLVSAWHSARDADERDRLHGLIRRGLPRGADESELVALALQAGDTSFALRAIRQLPAPLDVPQMELLLPLLRDPGVSLDFAVGWDIFYEAVRDRLLQAPPVLLADSTQWPCSPAACRLLSAQYDAPGDPRLRDLALIARFGFEPVRWQAEITRRVEGGSALILPAAHLLAGVGATRPGVEPVSLPAPGADWRAWLEWMTGRNPDAPAPSEPSPSMSFERSHSTAIRFFESRTGRAVVGELRRRYADAGGEPEALVFGAILVGLGERWTTPEELAAVLRSGSDAERALARRELMEDDWFGAAVPVLPELEAELLARALEIVIEGADPWPGLEPMRVPPGRATRRDSRGNFTMYIQADSLPASVRDRWRDRATFISAADWEADLARVPARLLRPRSVLRNGPFVWLRIPYETRGRRLEDNGVVVHGGGFYFVLMQGPEGWVEVEALEVVE